MTAVREKGLSLLFPCSLVLLFFLFLFRADLALPAARDGLLLCGRTVIPSLFPCLFLSEMLVRTELPSYLGATLGKPLQKIYRLSPDGASALLLGWFCGFPTGAVTAARLRGEGRISQEEYAYLLGFGNLPSIGFCVNAVGASILGDARLGWAIFASLLLAAVFTGLLGRPVPSAVPLRKTVVKKGGIFTAAMESAAHAMLLIGGYVVFFSVLTRLAAAALAGVAPPLRVFLCGSLEMTCGTASTAALVPPLRPLFCAFFLGFSGFSVHFQLLSIAKEPFPVLPYLLKKIGQGLLASLFLLPFIR